MLSNLLESGRRPARSFSQSFLSLACHVALGVGAIRATRQAIMAPPSVLIDTTAIFIARPAPAAPPVVSAPAGAVSPIDAAPPEATVVDVPTEIPSGIPPVDLGQRFDQWRFAGTPVASGCEGCAAARPDSTVIFTEATVDQAVELVSRPRPVYPRGFESMGVAGRATIEFVVTADGKVAPGTLTVVAASHPAFGESAIQAFADATFRPARVGTTAVRQLVRQTVRFEAGRP